MHPVRNPAIGRVEIQERKISNGVDNSAFYL